MDNLICEKCHRTIGIGDIEAGYGTINKFDDDNGLKIPVAQSIKIVYFCKTCFGR